MPVPAYTFLMLSGVLFTMGAIGFLVYAVAVSFAVDHVQMPGWLLAGAAWLVWVVSQEAGSSGVLGTVAGLVLLGFAGPA